MPDKSFDLAIVDPPYGINAPAMSMGKNKNQIRKGRLNSGGGKLKNRLLNQSSIGWDDTPPSPEYFAMLRRVACHQVVWGGNYFDLPPSRCVVCWDKQQPWENFSQWEMAWTSFDKPAAMFAISNTCGANQEKKIHPTQKPVALYAGLLNRYAKEGDTILDTHLGSGSSAIAANRLGFEFVGIELDADYFEAAFKRISAAHRQQDMFAPQAEAQKSEQVVLLGAIKKQEVEA